MWPRTITSKELGKWTNIKRPRAITSKELCKWTNIKWPRTITSKELYKGNNTIPWSITVSKRRLSGHLIRLPNETLARKAVKSYTIDIERSIGDQKQLL